MRAASRAPRSQVAIAIREFYSRISFSDLILRSHSPISFPDLIRAISERISRRLCHRSTLLLVACYRWRSRLLIERCSRLSAISTSVNTFLGDHIPECTLHWSRSSSIKLSPWQSQRYPHRASVFFIELHSHCRFRSPSRLFPSVLFCLYFSRFIKRYHGRLIRLLISQLRTIAHTRLITGKQFKMHSVL